MKKNSFVVYRDWWEAMKNLPEEYKFKVYESLMDFGFNGQLPEDPIIYGFVSFMCGKIVRDKEKFEQICKKRSEAGKKGAKCTNEKRWGHREENVTELSEVIVDKSTSIDTCRQNSSNSAENESEIENEIERENDNDHDNKIKKKMVITNHTSFQRNNSEGMAGSDQIEFDNFLGFFNQTLDKYDSSIPRARIIDKRRRSILNARVRQFGLDAVKDVVEKAARSDFLNGGGNKGFKADFTWIMRPDNFLKILEGNYDNNNNTNDLKFNRNETDKRFYAVGNRCSQQSTDSKPKRKVNIFENF